MMPHPVLAPQSQPTDAQLSPRAEAGGRGTGVDQGTQTRRGDMLRSPEAAAQDSADTIFEGSACRTGIAAYCRNPQWRCDRVACS